MASLAASITVFGVEVAFTRSGGISYSRRLATQDRNKGRGSNGPGRQGRRGGPRGKVAAPRWTPSGGATKTLQLGKALERVIAHGSPWVYADALRGQVPAPGTLADLLDTQGRFLARGLCESGPIGFRVLTLDRQQSINQGFWKERIDHAFRLRAHLDLGDTNAYRLLHGEADRLPGVVVDRYDDRAVLRLDGDAVQVQSDDIIAQLWSALQNRGIKHLYRIQGRGPSRSLQVLHGEPCQGPMVVREHGMKLVVDLENGQKTGLFLDHRDSRRDLRTLCANWRALHGPDKPLRVLNLYAYTGGFSIAAGLGGATEVVSVDISAPALEMARQSWEANGLPAQGHRGYAGKAEHFLAGPDCGSFDIVIADPPSFAPNERVKAKALGAYRAMHRSALSCVREGGFYLTASCSSHVDRISFEGTLREGAHGAGKSLQILSRGGAGADHPVLLGFAGGDYLCALLTRVASKRRA